MADNFKTLYRQNRRTFSRQDGESRRDFRTRIKALTNNEIAARQQAAALKADPLPDIHIAPLPDIHKVVPPEIIQGKAEFGVQGPIRDAPITSTLAGRNIGYRNAFAQTLDPPRRAYNEKGELQDYASDKNIKEKQQMLIDAGYDLGRTGADGLWGKKSQAAWKAYLADKAARESEEGQAAAKAASKVNVTPSSSAGLTADDIIKAGERALSYFNYQDGDSTLTTNPTAAMDSISKLNPDSTLFTNLSPFGEGYYARDSTVFYTPRSAINTHQFEVTQGDSTYYMPHPATGYTYDSQRGGYVNPQDSSLYRTQGHYPNDEFWPYSTTDRGQAGVPLTSVDNNLAYAPSDDYRLYYNEGHGYRALPAVPMDSTVTTPNGNLYTRTPSGYALARRRGGTIIPQRFI